MVALPRLRCLSLLQQGGLLLNQLKQIHAQMITNGLNCRRAVSIVGKLVECYCNVSAPVGKDYARLILNHADEPNVFIWNVMIRCMPSDEAIRLFATGNVLCDVVFDKFTYVFVLGACARSSSSTALYEGKQIHTRIVKIGLVSDVLVHTTNIHFYANCKDIVSARQVFDEMSERSSATWNAMISGYLSLRMRTNDNADEALILFRKMLLGNHGVKPTDMTMVCVLSASSRLGDLMTGSCLHGYIHKTIYAPEDDVFIGTGLVNMYSKCGCLSTALIVFTRMKVKNVLTWTSMMAGLALHGLGKEALELLGAMETANIIPNAVTFTSLLFACCHSGLVEEGLHLFHNMNSKFGIKPQIQHYGCIVDLLGRVGRLQEAHEFIIGMPMEPDVILWRSLLGACKIHGDVAMGEEVGKILLGLQHGQELTESESSCEDYVSLSNVYASAERWEDVGMVREMMKFKGIETKPGCSSVQSVSHLLVGI